MLNIKVVNGSLNFVFTMLSVLKTFVVYKLKTKTYNCKVKIK